MRTLKLTQDTIQNILTDLLKRSPNNYSEFEGRVNEIIEEVRKNRDAALFAYTENLTEPDWTPIHWKYLKKKSRKRTARWMKSCWK